MDSIQNIFARNLRRTREERGLSLDQTAKQCGVSKSMLAQIEKGTTSPTISTTWKISNGLKIPFTDLFSRPELDVEIINHNDISPLLECDGKYRNYPLFNYTQDRRFELYYIELDSGAVLNAKPHPQNTHEFLTIFSGALKVTVNGEEFFIEDGHSLRFMADQPHRYENVGAELCRLNMVISYN